MKRVSMPTEYVDPDGSLTPQPVYWRRIFPWHLGFLLLVGALGLFKMVNADIWWHLRTGELILERGEIPRTDWYTYTNPDAPWVDLHWIFQIMAWCVYSITGSAGLVLVKCSVGMAAFFALLSIRKRNWDGSLDVLCWFVPVLLFSGRFIVRPEVLTIAFLAATILVLHLAERRPRLLWCLPFIQLAWVNTQSLFVLQWVVLACYTLDAGLRGMREGKNVLPVSRRRWGAVLGVSALATICNPYGIRGALFPLVVFGKVRGPDREFYHTFAKELRGPLDMISEFGLTRVLFQPTVLLMLILFGGAVAATAFRWKRGDLEIFRTLLLLAFSYLAIKMTRNSALFAVVAGYVLRWNLGSLLEEGKGRGIRAFHRWSRPLAIAILIGGILLVGSGNYHAGMRVLPPRELGVGESGWYPHEAGQRLLVKGMPDTFYAQHLGVAAVCLHHAGPEKRVFADARLETNTRDTLARYKEISDGLGMKVQASLDVLTGNTDPLRWPALVIANSELIARQGMLDFLAGHPEWVCVYSSPPPGLNLGDPGREMVGGASIFVARKRQLSKGLPEADTRWLFAVATKRTRGY
jgi:hypothetical protein